MVRYYAMHRAWKLYGPPVYVSVALKWGLVTPTRSEPKIENFDDLVNYVGAQPGATVEPSPFPSLS